MVDGRNPAPVDRWFIMFIPSFIGFYQPKWQRGAGFLPSTGCNYEKEGLNHDSTSLVLQIASQKVFEPQKPAPSTV
jgi:hypothetical protein